MIFGSFKSGELVGLIKAGAPVEEYRMWIDLDPQSKSPRFSIVNTLTGLRLASRGGKFFWTRDKVYCRTKSRSVPTPGSEVDVLFDGDETVYKFKLIPAITKTTSDLKQTLAALEKGEKLDTGYNETAFKCEPEQGTFKTTDMLTVAAIFIVFISLAALAYFFCLLSGMI